MMTPRSITRLLIANRGEIAVRIMRTAHLRGIECVAVYSDPDAGSLHVECADVAVALGGTTSAQSYLDMDKILDAARSAGADAIHPGYGFLSENADFARAVLDAGLTWVGPPPDAIAAMAEKVPAKRLVSAAGVPLVPGAELSDDTGEQDLLATAAEVGYPLMVKASAGGGGKGMRVVGSPADLVESIAGARREAESAFGDATVFLERYLPTARHIEVQVFADDHGQVKHVFERECSIQRRHQKVIEEAPAPFLSASVRDGLRAAAVAAAAAIDYRGAGTVEFLVAGEEYFFLEMNTRLQVEHPVTELVAGLDLVALQLDVAEGSALPPIPDQPVGHAIEARLYAEDPSHDDLPSVGTLHEFTLDTAAVRVDSGFRTGDEVSPYYDPMLAKVIAHGPSRERAAAVLERALRRATIHGVITNRDLLAAVLRSPAFLNAAVDTSFLVAHPELRSAGPPEDVRLRHGFAVAAARLAVGGADIGEVASRIAAPAWRNVPVPCGISVVVDGAPDDPSGLRTVVHRRQRRDGSMQWGASTSPVDADAHEGQIEWSDVTVTVTRLGVDTAEVRVRSANGVTSDCRLAWVVAEDEWTFWVDEALHHSAWSVPSPFAATGTTAGAAGPSAPVPGTVAAVLVSPGQQVQAGQALVVIEAMKMEHRICADTEAVVVEVPVAVGDSVEAHQVLVTLDAETTTEAAALDGEDAPTPEPQGAGT